SEDVAQARVAFDARMKTIQARPTAVKMVEELRLPLQSGSIFARHYHPAPQKKLPMVIFYHGGAFMVGGLDSHDEFCRRLVVHAKAQVLSVADPLTPECSPLQMVQVCEDALAWAHQHRKQIKVYKNRIALAGDSAGGNLATVVAQRSVG
ncbi:alpha/beta hydrolase fold domain-containing protein, partial [Klebsiella pneumoniae]|nr:alpha/beta hydrolase fold domain-containing protein [Klebsiella pneumoniae]